MNLGIAQLPPRQNTLVMCCQGAAVVLGAAVVSCAGLFARAASRLFFAWLRGLARLCTYMSSLLSVVSGALSFTVSYTPAGQPNRAALQQIGLMQ
jgi:hypothetical protein